MAIWTHKSRLTVLLSATCLGLCVSGCGGPNLQGYKPAPTVTGAKNNDTTEPSTSANQPTSPTAETTTVAKSDADEAVPVSALIPVNMPDGINVRALMSVPATDLASKSDTADGANTSGSAAQPASSEPRKIELLVKEKVFRTDSKTGSMRLSFDDLDLLKVLNMDPVVENAVELMPDWLKSLEGKTVRLRGFMFPTYDTEGIEQFVLARDNQICCFGRDPKVYDLVQVNLKEGKTTNYIPATRAFDVIGKFHIDMQFQDGKPFGLYLIDNAEVIDR